MYVFPQISYINSPLHYSSETGGFTEVIDEKHRSRLNPPLHYSSETGGFTEVIDEKHRSRLNPPLQNFSLLPFYW
jgi:hypothetical protein